MISDGKVKKDFSIVYKIDDGKIKEALNNLKGSVDYAPVDGYFDLSEGVRYNAGVDGYSLNVDTSAVEVEKAISNGLNDKQKLIYKGMY